MCGMGITLTHWQFLQYKNMYLIYYIYKLKLQTDLLFGTYIDSQTID